LPNFFFSSRMPTRDSTSGHVNQDSSQEFQPRRISLLAPFSLGWRDKNKVIYFGLLISFFVNITVLHICNLFVQTLK
jgi:hypothetical protein